MMHKWLTLGGLSAVFKDIALLPVTTTLNYDKPSVAGRDKELMKFAMYTAHGVSAIAGLAAGVLTKDFGWGAAGYYAALNLNYALAASNAEDPEVKKIFYPNISAFADKIHTPS